MMKKYILLLPFIFFSLLTFAQTFERYYGTNYEESSKMIPAIDGGFIIVSSTTFPSATSGNQADILIVKIDTLGFMQWSESLRSPMDDEGVSIEIDKDSTYLISANSYDNINNKLNVSIIKLNNVGTVLSQKFFSSYDAERVWCTKLTTDGGVILAGETLFNSSDLQMFLLKLDSLKNIQWSMAYGDADQEYGTSVIEAKDHGFVETGVARINSFYSSICVLKTGIEGGLQWAKKYNTSPIQTKCLSSGILATNDGGYLISGTTFDVLLKSAMLLMKIDSVGDIEWQKIYTSSNDEYLFDITKDKLGYTFCGPLSDQNAIDHTIICNVDSLGNLNWQLGFEVADSNMTPYSISKNVNNNYFITGVTDATTFGTPHVLLIETDSSGSGLCNSFIPALNQVNSHLVADPFFGSTVDTTHLVNIQYTVSVGVQEQQICAGSTVGIPPSSSDQDQFIFQDSNGDLIVKVNETGAFNFQIYNTQGQLSNKFSMLATGEKQLLLSRSEFEKIFSSTGIYLITCTSNTNSAFTQRLFIRRN